MGLGLWNLNSPKRKEALILVLCLLIGFALRFYTFDQKSLWIDEIYTFNDSKDGIEGQLKFYKENPSYLHPPLYFLLTHLFYPFTHPERDLRIIPLISGTLSIPMIYLLAGSVSPAIGLPCALSLTFMAYHISLSQDGRSYSLMMFIGMAGLYFFMKYLKTSKKRYLFWVALLYAILFHTSYNSVFFIALSQILWFYHPSEEAEKRPFLSSFLLLNSILLLLCLPWILFVTLNYKGQHFMPAFQDQSFISFWGILYGVLHDWVPYAPLMVTSAALLLFLPFLSTFKRNAFLLLAVMLSPVGGLYLFCTLFRIAHFVSSRYLINFLPLFFISLYLSIDAVENRLPQITKSVRVKPLFIILLIACNLLILHPYYRSEKQDLRGLAVYLERNLKEGDKLFDADAAYTPGILHYFGVYPEGRHYQIPYRKVSEGGIELRKSFVYQNRIFTIYCSKGCCAQYVADGSRLWIVTGKPFARKLKEDPQFVLKGYFDGSFLNFDRFPMDASMYLFLLDPKSPNEKGIEIVIE